MAAYGGSQRRTHGIQLAEIVISGGILLENDSFSHEAWCVPRTWHRTVFMERCTEKRAIPGLFPAGIWLASAYRRNYVMEPHDDLGFLPGEKRGEECHSPTGQSDLPGTTSTPDDQRRDPNEVLWTC
jgi:hypothetical protein